MADKMKRMRAKAYEDQGRLCWKLKGIFLPENNIWERTERINLLAAINCCYILFKKHDMNLSECGVMGDFVYYVKGRSIIKMEVCFNDENK